MVSGIDPPSFNKVSVGPSLDVTPKVVGQTEDIDMDVEFKYGGLAGKQGNAPIVLNHGFRSKSIVVKSGGSPRPRTALGCG